MSPTPRTSHRAFGSWGCTGANSPQAGKPALARAPGTRGLWGRQARSLHPAAGRGCPWRRRARACVSACASACAPAALQASAEYPGSPGLWDPGSRSPAEPPTAGLNSRGLSPLGSPLVKPSAVGEAPVPERTPRQRSAPGFIFSRNFLLFSLVEPSRALSGFPSGRRRAGHETRPPPATALWQPCAAGVGPGQGSRTRPCPQLPARCRAPSAATHRALGMTPCEGSFLPCRPGRSLAPRFPLPLRSSYRVPRSRASTLLAGASGCLGGFNELTRAERESGAWGAQSERGT